MGSTFRFIHCADLHLGSRFKGIRDYDPALAERMRKSIFESFSRIVDLAITEHVDAFIISGDVYDDSIELPSTRMWLSEQFSRLRIPVFICRGNHDSATSWDSSIIYPDNVHEFSTSPECIRITDDVEIVGISYEEQHETRNLVKELFGHPDKFSIGCVHCDIDRFSEGYAYAPCSESDMRGRAIDYWALGHIHKRTVVSTSPYIVYPGNIQGRSFKEIGQKGAYLVTVKDKIITSAEFIPTQTFVWKELEVDISGKPFNEILSEIRSNVKSDTVARIRFIGNGILDSMLRTRKDDVRVTIESSTSAVISSLSVETAPEIDFLQRANGKDMVGAIIRSGEKIKTYPRERIIDIICENKIAARNRDFYSNLSDEELRRIVDDSVKSIICRLVVTE